MWMDGVRNALLEVLGHVAQDSTPSLPAILLGIFPLFASGLVEATGEKEGTAQTDVHQNPYTTGLIV